MSLDPTDFEEQAYSDECQTAWNCGNHDGKTRTGWDREYYNSLEDHLKEEYKKGYAIGWKNFYNPQCA